MQKTKPRSKRSWALLASVVALAVMALVPASAMAAPVVVKPALDFSPYGTWGQWQPGAIDDDLVAGTHDLWWFNGNVMPIVGPVQDVEGDYQFYYSSNDVNVSPAADIFNGAVFKVDGMPVNGVVRNIPGGYDGTTPLAVNFTQSLQHAMSPLSTAWNFSEGIHTVESWAQVNETHTAGDPITTPVVKDTFGIDNTAPEFAHVMSLKWDPVKQVFTDEYYLPLEKGDAWSHADQIFYNLDYVKFAATVHDPAGSGVAPTPEAEGTSDWNAWQVDYDDWMWEGKGCVWNPCQDGNGTAAITLSAEDMVGNKVSADYHINFDQVDPVTAYKITPDDADQQDGWTNKPVTVEFLSADGQADCRQASGSDADAVQPTSGVAYTEYVVKQVASHEVPAAPGIKESGTKGTSVTIDTTAPVGPTYIWYRSVDNAVPEPNYESWKLVVVYFDNQAPVLSDNYPGWWMNTPFDVEISVNDHNSGLAAPGIEYQISPFVAGHPSLFQGTGKYVTFGFNFGAIADGIYQLGYRATDKAGNAAVGGNELKVDTRAPETAGTVPFTDKDHNNWINGLEPYVLTATDQTPGSGVQATVYRVDQAMPWLFQAFVPAVSPARTQIAIAGAHGTTHTVDFASIDASRPGWWTAAMQAANPALGFHLGNWEFNPPTDFQMDSEILQNLYRVNLPGDYVAFKSASVTLDKVAPICTVTNPINPNWQPDTATLNFVGSDEGSGYKGTEWSTDGGMTWQLTTSGQAQVGGDGEITVIYRGVDNVGIRGENHTVVVKVATTGPSNQVKNATVKKGKNVTVKFKINAVTEKASVNILFRKNGKTFMLKRYSQVTTNQWVSRTFRVNIAKGKYLIRVDATDLAGNVQLKRGQANLTVK